MTRSADYLRQDADDLRQDARELSRIEDRVKVLHEAAAKRIAIHHSRLQETTQCITNLKAKLVSMMQVTFSAKPGNSKLACLEAGVLAARQKVAHLNDAVKVAQTVNSAYCNKAYIARVAGTELLDFWRDAAMDSFNYPNIAFAGRRAYQRLAELRQLFEEKAVKIREEYYAIDASVTSEKNAWRDAQSVYRDSKTANDELAKAERARDIEARIARQQREAETAQLKAEEAAEQKRQAEVRKQAEALRIQQQQEAARLAEVERLRKIEEARKQAEMLKIQQLEAERVSLAKNETASRNDLLTSEIQNLMMVIVSMLEAAQTSERTMLSNDEVTSRQDLIGNEDVEIVELMHVVAKLFEVATVSEAMRKANERSTLFIVENQSRRDLLVEEGDEISNLTIAGEAMLEAAKLAQLTRQAAERTALSADEMNARSRLLENEHDAALPLQVSAEQVREEAKMVSKYVLVMEHGMFAAANTAPAEQQAACSDWEDLGCVI